MTESAHLQPSMVTYFRSKTDLLPVKTLPKYFFLPQEMPFDEHYLQVVFQDILITFTLTDWSSYLPNIAIPRHNMWWKSDTGVNKTTDTGVSLVKKINK